MRSTAIITLILLLAAFVRVHQLGTQSFWNDEGSSYVQATRSFRDIAINAAADIHPPGYYWALKVWRSVAGDTEFALRYLSALAGVLTVAFAYGLGRRLYPYQRPYGVVVGLVAAGLVALNTFSITYSQEARMYAVLALWGAASMWALVGFFYHPTWRNGLVLGVFNALGLWTQYAFPLVMLAQGAVALLWLLAMVGWGHFRRALVGYVLANALAILLFAPILPTALRQVTMWPNTGVDVPYPQALGVVMNWLAFGITYAETNTTWIAIMLILVLFGLRDMSIEHALTRQNLHSRWRALLPVLGVVVPVGIFVAAGLFREGNVKFLLPSQVGFALAVGQGAAGLVWLMNRRRAEFSHSAPTVKTAEVVRVPRQSEWLLLILTRGLAAIALVGVFWQVARAVPPLYTNPDYQRSDYRALVNTIAPALDANDAVILNAPGQIEVFRYYYDGDLEPLRIPFGLNDTNAEIQQATERVLRQSDDIFLVLWGDAERDPDGIVEQTLDANAFEISNEWYGDVRLARYATEAERFNYVEDVNVRFGDVILLERFALNDNELGAGEVLQVRLFWQAIAPMDTRYKVTLQLLDENGVLVAQRDAEPGGGSQPTDTWLFGERVTDNHALMIPAEEAHLTLIVALYNPQDSNARLPVSTSREDYLDLTTITITQPEAE